MPSEGPAVQASGHALRHPHHSPGTGCRPRRHGRPPLRRPEHARARRLRRGGRLRPDRGARRGDHRGRRVRAAPQPLRLDRRRDRASRPCPRDPPGCGLARDRLRDLAAAARRGPLHRGSRHGVPCPGATPRGRYPGAAPDPDAGRHPARDPVRAGRTAASLPPSSGSPSAPRSGAPTPHPTTAVSTG